VRPVNKFIGSLLPILLVACLPAAAQLAPASTDPLARIREAAKGNTQACSATGETLCEQIAPKIVSNAEGDSPLEANLLHLFDVVRSQDEPVEWAISSFRDVKIDVHLEKNPLVTDHSVTGSQEGEDVIAEIRGREKPDEWVLLGAFLGDHPDLEDDYNAALVIEAARDIQLTGIHPRRSLRFVLFGPGDSDSSHYVQAHRNELDRASAVLIFDAAANPVTGFVLNGRNDIEAGVNKALDPIYPMGVTHHTFDAPLERNSLSFLLEGIPTLLAPPPDTDGGEIRSLYVPIRVDGQELARLKRNTAIAAVTAFDIAEQAEPIGPRQSHAQIESLLTSTGLDQKMKTRGLWASWQSGQRGRLP